MTTITPTDLVPYVTGFFIHKGILLQQDRKNGTNKASRFPIPYGEFLEKNGGSCPICHGGEAFRIDKGILACLCVTLWYVDQTHQKITDFNLRTKYDGTYPLEALEIINRPAGAGEKTQKIKRFAERFANEGHSWLYLWSKGSGTGKTHILRYINEALWPMALYIAATDLQRIIMNFSDEKREDKIRFLSHCPVLLLDDLGAQHVTAKESDYFLSTVQSIIEERSSSPMKHLTIITSNNNPSTEYVKSLQLQRIYSRMLDKKYSANLELTQEDYRIS